MGLQLQAATHLEYHQEQVVGQVDQRRQRRRPHARRRPRLEHLRPDKDLLGIFEESSWPRHLSSINSPHPLPPPLRCSVFRIGEGRGCSRRVPGRVPGRRRVRTLLIPLRAVIAPAGSPHAVSATWLRQWVTRRAAILAEVDSRLASKSDAWHTIRGDYRRAI